MKSKTKNVANISSSARLEDILEETERELEIIQPKIDKLESQLEKLKELKLAKQKLITLKLSIKSILSNFSSQKNDFTFSSVDSENLSKKLSIDFNPDKLSTSPKLNYASKPNLTSPGGTFFPDLAFQQVDTVLRKKTSINYDLFRGIVFNGGKASTEQIRQYLVEQGIKQPGSGEGFEEVPLTDISSRVNYLVRKGVVTPDGRGTFVSCFGWNDSP